VVGARRTGAGPVTVTGTAGSEETVQVRFSKDGKWVIAGTAEATPAGEWSYTLGNVAARTYVKVWRAGSNVASAAARVDVTFAVTFTVSTKGGYVYSTVKENPVVKGSKVRWEQFVNGKWVKVAQQTVNAKGVASLKWDTAKGKTYKLRAYVFNGGTVLPAYTAAKSVRSS
jgi:hypothetical protein